MSKKAARIFRDRETSDPGKPSGPEGGWPWTRLARIEAKLDTALATLATLTATEKADMADIITDLADLQAKLTANTSAVQSAEALLSGLKAQLDAAIAALANAGATPAQLAIIEQVSAALDANSSGLAAAVVANTPAAPAP